jgi:glycosyltransferase involved in cell wall biosynthesis
MEFQRLASRLNSPTQLAGRLHRRSPRLDQHALLLAARPAHVAIVSETAAPDVNGVAHTVAHLVDGLRRSGYRVSLVCPLAGDDACRREPPSPDLLRTPGLPIPGYPSLRFGLPCRSRLLERWRSDTPDLVHVVTEGPLGSSAIAAARDLGLPVTSSFHTHFEHYCRHYGLSWLAPVVEAYLRRFHNRTDLTLVPTRALSRQMAASGFRNLDVLGRGIDDSLFRPERRNAALRDAWGAAGAELVVLSVGRLAAEKNLDLLFTAFAAIAARQPGARLVVVGDGPRAAELRRAHPQAIFTGTRRGDDLAAHYASADLFLFPSLTETYGNVIVEAMASGLPVVAYDRGAAGEWIVDGNNGIRVREGDAAAFVAAALSIAEAPAARATMGQRAAITGAGANWSVVSSQFATQLDRIYQRHIRQSDYRARVAFGID